jgi:hypothetical protein
MSDTQAQPSTKTIKKTNYSKIQPGHKTVVVSLKDKPIRDIRIPEHGRHVRTIGMPAPVPIQTPAKRAAPKVYATHKPEIKRMPFSVKSADGTMYAQYSAIYDVSKDGSQYKQVDNEEAANIAQQFSNKIYENDRSNNEYIQVTIGYRSGTGGRTIWRNGSQTLPGHPISMPNGYDEDDDFGQIENIMIIFGVPII